MTAEARRKWKAGLPRASPWVLCTRSNHALVGLRVAAFDWPGGLASTEDAALVVSLRSAISWLGGQPSIVL
jgi:hypothetical protein